MRKFWGYLDDEEVTTHPIACEVANTSKADSIFDGITYSKGASVLKQLYYIIGHDAFSKKLANYFKKYEWKNATLSNFLDELNKAEEGDHKHTIDLKDWN